MISPDTLRSLRPLPGRCVIQLDELPALSQGKHGTKLHIPDSSRRLLVDNIAFTGKVLTMTPRRDKGGQVSWENFKSGDHVHVMLRGEDLKTPDRIIVTDNRRVYAVIEERIPV